MTTRLLPILFVLTVLLSACGSGGGGSSATSPSAPSSMTLTVTPALGMVRGASVRVRDISGRELALGMVDAQGQVQLVLPGGNNPFVVELNGGLGAEYYDEGMEQWHALPSGVVLHAASAGNDRQLTVSALTEIAYRRALFLGSGQLSAAVITQSHSDIASQLSLVGEALDFPLDFAPLSPAQVVDGSAPLDLAQQQGRYALLLAGITRYAFLHRVLDVPDCVDHPDCFPLSGAMDELMTDIAEERVSASELPWLIVNFLENGLVYNGRRQPPMEGAAADVMAEIGNAFAGSHALACEGVAEPVQLRVLPSGEVALKGSMGSAWWGATSPVWANSLVGRSYALNAAGTSFVLSGQHVENDGGGRALLVADSSLAVREDGVVTLTHAGTTYQCTGMPVKMQAVPAFTQIIRPGNYGCGGSTTAAVSDEYALVTGSILSSIYLQRSSFTGYGHTVSLRIDDSQNRVTADESFYYQGSPVWVGGSRLGSVGRQQESFRATAGAFLSYSCNYSGS